VQLCRLIERLDRNKLDIGLVAYYHDAMAASLFQLPGLYCSYTIPFTPSPSPDSMKPLGRLWIPTPFALEYFVLARHILRKHRPHVIYLNNSPRQHLPILWAAQRQRLPIIAHLREFKPLVGIDKLGIPYITKFVALCNTAAQHYIAQGIDSSMIRVAYDIFPLAQFDRDAMQTPSAILPSGYVYAVQVGTLDENKRPTLAVESLVIAKRSCPKLRLVLVGEGPARRDVEQLIKRHQLQNDVILLGHRSDVPALLRQCHIGVLLSQREGFPNVILEYMAARLPVIVTSFPSVDELVLRNRTAVLLDKYTPDAIAQALAQLYVNSEQRTRMGEAARGFVECCPSVHHDSSRIVQSVILEQIHSGPLL